MVKSFSLQNKMNIQKYNQRTEKVNSLVCVGLDSDFAKIQQKFFDMEYPQFEFNKYIIDETNEFVSAYKPNTAFYEARGDQGIKELKMTMDYLNEKYPDIFTILDAKRADIGNTNNGYATFAFDWLGADAVTLHPYLGREALAPFLDRKDKTSIILCKTSNSGSAELQDLQIFSHCALPEVSGGTLADKKFTSPEVKFVYEFVAEKVSNEWNENKNCMLVVGATYPEEMKKIREITGDMTFLVPGIGAQGGDLEAVIKNGMNADKKGLIISSSRGIIFSENPKLEAKKLRDEMIKYQG